MYIVGKPGQQDTEGGAEKCHRGEKPMTYGETQNAELTQNLCEIKKWRSIFKVPTNMLFHLETFSRWK